MDDRSNKQRIIDAIKGEGKPLKPKDISEISHIGAETVRTTVRLMLHKGELSQPEYGKYDLPKSEQQLNTARFDSPGSIPQTRDVQHDVQAVPPLDLVENDHIKNDKRRVSSAGNPATLEDKILSLVDLDAMKQLVEAGAGDVQEGFFSVFRRMHDGDVYKFTVRVEVELERGQNTRMTKPQTKGPPDSDANE